MVTMALLGTRGFLGTHYMRPVGTFDIIIQVPHIRHYVPNVHKPRRICPATAVNVVAATGNNPHLIANAVRLNQLSDNAAIGNLAVDPRRWGIISPKNPFVFHYESAFDVSPVTESHQFIYRKV
jgi:esterase/lipase superfamily enzyme